MNPLSRPLSNHVMHWREQRRRFLLGPITTWALSACESLPRDPGHPATGSRSAPGSALAGKAVSPPGVEPTLLRQIDFDRPSRVANHMAWSADGQRLAIAASLDVRVTIVDVSTGRPLPAPGEQFGGVDALAYSPDGRYLAVIRHGTGPISDPSGRYTVSLWDARTAAFARNIVEPGRSEISSLGAHALAFSSDGRSLAVAYLKQTAIYTIGDGGAAQRVSILPPASRCAFRPGAPVVACLATGPRPRALVLHEVPGGGVIAPPAAHGSNLSWSPDGRWLAIADDQQIGIHDISRARDVTTVSTPDPGVQFRSVSFSSDGRWLAAASHRRLEVWETATWSHAASLGNRQKFIAAAAFSPRGRLLAAVGDAPVDIWDLG